MHIVHDAKLSVRDHRMTRRRSTSRRDGAGSTLSCKVYTTYIEQCLQPLVATAELRDKLCQSGSSGDCLEIKAVGAPHKRSHKRGSLQRLSG